MKRMKMISQKGVTFEEGCNLYLNNCKERNLREGTINHYRQSYLNFYKFFDKEMSLSDFSEKHYSDYVLHLRKTLSNDVSINAYLRDMITTMHFIKIKDVDFNNQVVHINVTKNRKALIVPISKTMTNILEEYLKYRQHKSKEDYLNRKFELIKKI